MARPIPRLLTVDEVAEILRLDRDETMDLLDRQELDAIDLPRGIIRIRATDLEAFLRVRRRLFTMMIDRGSE